MGSHTNSSGLLSPRRRLRGYVSLEHTTEDSSENQATCGLLDPRKATYGTSQCSENVYSDLLSPKASPVLRRMQMSRLRRMLSPKSTKKLEHIILSDKTEKQWLEYHASTSSLESLEPVEQDCVERPPQHQSTCNNYSTVRRSRHISESSNPCPKTPKARSSFSSERKTLLHVLLTKTFGRSHKTNRYQSEQSSPGLSARKHDQQSRDDFNGFQLKWKHMPANPTKSAPCSPMFDIRTSPTKNLKPRSTYLSNTENRKLYSNCSGRIQAKNGSTGNHHHSEILRDFDANDPLSIINNSKKCCALELRTGDSTYASISRPVNFAEQPTSTSRRQSCPQSDSSPHTCSPKSRTETPPPSYFDLSHPNALPSFPSNFSPLQATHQHTKIPTTPPNVNKRSVHCDSCWRHQSAFWYLNQSSATILRNDLGTGQTTTPSIVAPNMSSPTQRQVVLHRDPSCQRFGMKLGRTDRPEQITYIAMILPRSPACDAGLQVGDRILTVNETNVDNLSLDSAIDLIRTADRILKLTYEPRPFTSYLLTMLVRKQDGKVGIRLKNQQVLQIDVVLPHSPAARVGLRAGQRVIGINGHNVVYWDHSAAMKWLRAYPDEKDLLITVSENPIQLDGYKQSGSGSQLNDTSSCSSELDSARALKEGYSLGASQFCCPECSPAESDVLSFQEAEHNLSIDTKLLAPQERFKHSDFNENPLSTECWTVSPRHSHEETTRHPRELFSNQLKPFTRKTCTYKDSSCERNSVHCVPRTTMKRENLQHPLSTSNFEPFCCPCTAETLECFNPTECDLPLNRTQVRSTKTCSAIRELSPVDRRCNICQGQNEYV